MDAKQTIHGAFRRHGDVLAKTLAGEMAEIERGALILAEVAKSGHRLFICGNGGSAADSQHFAAEWTCKYKDDRKPLPAMALTVDTSALTAIGNDFGFDQIFVRPIDAHGRPGDVLVAITTSGRSKNVIAAMTKAKEKRMAVIVLTGEGGAALKASADIVIAIPSSETARIQEMHELIYHSWCEYVDSQL